VAEHPEVPGVEVESSEALGELSMCVGAELDQQEAETPAQVPRRGRLRVGRISGHVADLTALSKLFLI